MVNKKIRNIILSAIFTVMYTFSNTIMAFGIQKNYTTTRLGGADRYETAIQISDEYAKYSDNSLTNCIIARDDDFADSISVTPFSYYKNAPILLTQKDELNAKTQAQLKKLNIKNVFIIGGTGVISQNVESQLKALGYSVTRIGGKDRIETNRLLMAQIPKEVWGPRPKVINGYDWIQGMSVAQDITFWYPMDNKVYINPVFVISPNANSSDDIKDIGEVLAPIGNKWLNAQFGPGYTFKVPYKVGIDENFIMNISKIAISNNQVPDNLINNITASLGTYKVQEDIFSGYNQQTTQANVFQNYNYIFVDKQPNKGQTMAALLTRGDNFIDALAATSLAAKLRSPIVMANRPASEVVDKDVFENIKNRDFVETYGNVNKVYYIGGSGVIKDGSESFLNGN